MLNQFCPMTKAIALIYNGTMELFRLKKTHVPAASQALAESFLEDPFVCQISPDIATRARSVLPVFRFSTGLAVRNGEAWATSPAMEGVALWLPSWRISCPPLQWLRLGGMGIRRGLSAAGYRELSHVSDRIDRERDAIAPSRFLYLSCLGVRPQFRRRGLASALVEGRVKQAARDGLPTVVETNTPEALAFYRSLGFVVKVSFRAAELDYYVLEHPALPDNL